MKQISLSMTGSFDKGKKTKREETRSWPSGPLARFSPLRDPHYLKGRGGIVVWGCSGSGGSSVVGSCFIMIVVVYASSDWALLVGSLSYLSCAAVGGLW